MAIEYRLNWSASSNISFHGKTEWRSWWGDDELDATEVEAMLLDGSYPDGLQEVLEACGFEWYPEVREAEGENDG